MAASANTTGYRHHDLFQRPDPDAAIWRYFDLAKFLSVVVDNALYFPRVDQFEEPWEGVVAAWMGHEHPPPVATATAQTLVARSERPVHNRTAKLT